MLSKIVRPVKGKDSSDGSSTCNSTPRTPPVGRFGERQLHFCDVAHEVRDKQCGGAWDHGPMLGGAVFSRVVLTEVFGQPQDLGVAAPWGQSCSREPDPFAGTAEQDRHGQRQHSCAVCFGGKVVYARKAHRGPLVTPQHHGLGDLPFAFAHKVLIPHRAAPVIDHPQAVASLGGPVLPEIIADPCAPSPVFPKQHGTGQMLRPCEQGGGNWQLPFRSVREGLRD